MLWFSYSLQYTGNRRCEKDNDFTRYFQSTDIRDHECIFHSAELCISDAYFLAFENHMFRYFHNLMNRPIIIPRIFFVKVCQGLMYEKRSTNLRLMVNSKDQPR